MKKSLLIIILLSISLCGCKSSAPVGPQINNINFTTQAVIDNTEYIINAFVSDADRLELSVLSPDELKNLKLSFENETAVITYLNLEKEIPLKSFEENSIFKILFLGFKTAFEADTLSFKEDCYYLTFDVDNSKYEMHFAQSGLPLKIVSENTKTDILFKGISILN